MGSCDCFNRRQFKEHLGTGSVVFSILAFFATFLTLDFFGTLLALVTFILVASSSCHGETGITTTAVTACFLSFMTAGVMWWTVIAIVLTTVCDWENEENDNDNNNDNNWKNRTVRSNTTSIDDDNAWSPSPSSEDPSSSVEFFCEHRNWILGFTVVSATLWMCTGGLVLIHLMQPPPPPPPRRSRIIVDDDTVATIDDEALSLHENDNEDDEMQEQQRS